MVSGLWITYAERNRVMWGQEPFTVQQYTSFRCIRERTQLDKKGKRKKEERKNVFDIQPINKKREIASIRSDGDTVVAHKSHKSKSIL